MDNISPEDDKTALAERVKKGEIDELYSTQPTVINEIIASQRKFFPDRVVYCNCDDPDNSWIARVLINNFNVLKLRRIYVSGYGTRPGHVWVEKDSTGLYRHESQGDDHFASDHSRELLEKSDIVVTMPPYSLWDTFIDFLLNQGKDFFVLGPEDKAVSDRLFPLFAQKKLFYGMREPEEGFRFTVPRASVEGIPGLEYNAEGDCQLTLYHWRWFTTIRHSMADMWPYAMCNDRFDPARYPKFDNSPILCVPQPCDIPCDYEDVFSVPCGFFHHWNTEWFDVLGRHRFSPEGDPLLLNGRPVHNRILVKLKPDKIRRNFDYWIHPSLRAQNAPEEE